MNSSEIQNNVYPLCRNETSRYNIETKFAISITSILGLIGNLLSVSVLCMPQMRKEMHSLLLCLLALSDSFQLLMFTIFFGYPLVGLKVNPIYAAPFISKLFAFIGFVSLTCSTYLTVLLSLERYMAVCVPYKNRPLFPTKNRILLYAVAILIFSVLFNLVKWWELEPCLYQSQRGSFVSLQTSDLKRDDLYKKLYTFAATVLINFLAPFLILSILNVFIYKGMVAADKRKRRISVMGRRLHDSAITLMLVVVVAVFCVCNMFHMVSTTIGLFCRNSDGDGTGTEVECSISHAFFQVQIYLYSFNASINFVIYCFCGLKFRQQFIALFNSCRVFCCCLPRPPENRSSSQGSRVEYYGNGNSRNSRGYTNTEKSNNVVAIDRLSCSIPTASTHSTEL